LRSTVEVAARRRTSAGFRKALGEEGPLLEALLAQGKQVRDELPR